MTSITLRPYQVECVFDIREIFRELAKVATAPKRVLLVAPTGAGKTVMFSYLTQQSMAKSMDNTVLILTDRIELLGQAGGTLENFGIRYEPITAGKKVNHRARCFVGMLETYYNRLKKAVELAPNKEILFQSYLLGFKQVIFDEAHKGAFNKVFELWDEIGYQPFVIGATATPIPANKYKPLSNFYQAIVNRVQIADLVEQGYLTPCKTIAPEIDRSKLKIDKKGEYSEESQYETFATKSVYAGLLEEYQKVCDRYNNSQPIRTICFNVNIAHSLEVTQMFIDAGFRAVHVDGNTDKAVRKRIIEAYKRGEYDIICNVGILNAGFDDPCTRCIIFNRASTSVALWLQSCGRGSRIAPGKENFIVLDMGRNWFDLQLWDAERNWEEIWNQVRKKSDREGVAPAKECPQCSHIIPLPARLCPECGYVYPIKEKKLAEATAFVEVTADMVPVTPTLTDEQKAILRLNTRSNLPKLPIDVLLQIQELKGYKPGWILYIVNDRAETEEQFYEDVQAIAALKGHKPGWITRQQWRPKLAAA